MKPNATPTTGTPIQASPQTEADAPQLITDRRDAAPDGRRLADRFADRLERTVEAYCTEFEQRADGLLARLETIR